MKKKLLVYSDCILFGGSEKVLTNLFQSPQLFEAFEVQFAFRDHEAYRRGVEALELPFEVLPLKIKSFDGCYFKIHQKNLPKLLKKLLKAPMVTAERLGRLEQANLPVLRQLFEQNRPDVVFINNGGYPGAASCLNAAVAAKQAGVPGVVMMINNLATRPQGAAQHQRDEQVRRSVDRWVTASKAAGRQLIKNRGIAPELWSDLPNCLGDQEALLRLQPGKLRQEFGITPQTPVMVAAGHLTWRKGYQVAVEALGRIKEQLGEAQLFIFGEGELRAPLEASIKQLGLSGKVHLPGHRSNVVEYLVDADLFLMPSVDFEDFPYANLEAMILGKPIIGTEVAGIPEQVADGQTGLVIAPNDPEALAQAIASLLENPQRRQEMGQKAKARFFEQYDNQPVMNRFISLFSELAA
ncbi:MAG: glycosyltransferase family 4 protein [bacterium]|nr:glycosyltransferase family 4 protein [bacterium]